MYAYKYYKINRFIYFNLFCSMLIKLFQMDNIRSGHFRSIFQNTVKLEPQTTKGRGVDSSQVWVYKGPGE